jgi:phage replication O-like protein O
MASPQIEDGYLKYANELFDAVCVADLSGSAWRCFNYIIRKTYGFNKKVDTIALTQFEEGTHLTRMSVTRGLSELLIKNMITKDDSGYIVAYGVNKDYETWGSIKPVTSNKNDTETSIKPVTKTSNRNDTHKRHKDIKDMGGFNRKADDYLEDDVQIDPDHTPKGKKAKKVPDEVQEVFDLFKNPASALWRLREIERVAAQALYDTYGIETLKKRLQRIAIEREKKDPYFPDANTPSQLLDKMPNIERYLGI